MTTDSFAIARMTFDAAPKFDLGPMARDLAHALGAGLGCAVRPVRDTATTAAFELPGLRLVLSLATKGAPRLVVATGPSDALPQGAPLDEDVTATLAQTITQRLSGHLAPAHTDWSDCPSDLTEPGLDAALDALTCDAPAINTPTASGLDRAFGTALAAAPTPKTDPANSTPQIRKAAQ